MQHSTLVATGVRWLSRYCSVVLYEFATAADENPDVIGWAPEAGSVLIECKLNRSDFLRDAAKPVRKNPRVGMGHRRYYLCPPDLIQVKDLPPKWGLLWAARGQVIVKREARGHPERNLLAEVRFLSSMLRRAQIRIGARPLSEWLRGENRFEAKRGISPVQIRVIKEDEPHSHLNHASRFRLSGLITPVKPLELLGQALSRDGTVLKLVRRSDEYIILANGKSLMSSRMHGSEEALATFACRQAGTLQRPAVLIGGLGMGFTLRATLDLLPPDASVVVAEIVPAVVDWNRGPLGPLAGHPLNDPRVRVEINDVAVILSSRPGQFDAVLLDVDNGPAGFAASNNDALYDDRGIAIAFAALKMNGVLAVWSAREDRKFEQRLNHGRFDVEVERVRGRLKKGGPRHLIFLAHKSPGR